MYKKVLKNIKDLPTLKKMLDSLYKSEEHSVLARKPHFIFSAENPMYPENHVYNLKHDEVVKKLKQKGYKVESITGHYGKPERSILVHNPSKLAVSHLFDLAKKLGQESSIYSDGYNHEMHFHGGPNADHHIKGQGTTIHKRKPDDHFSELANGTSFSHIFNFDEMHPKEASIANDPDLSTKKTEVDFIKSEPNHPLIGAGPNTKLIHFSTTSGLKSIDPEHQGKRIKDASSKYGRPEHPVSFFYLEGAIPEGIVTSGAKSKYVARLGHKKLYDLGTDPEGIRNELRNSGKTLNPGIFTRDELDAAIKAKGYHGIYNSAHESEDMRKVVGMYHSMPIEKEHPFHPKDAEMATDQAFEQHHSVQKNEDEEFEAKLKRIDHIRKTTKPKKMKLAIEHIHQDPHGVANAHKTFHFTPDFKVSAKPVKVGVHIKTGKLYLLDGYHRAMAAQKRGETHINAEVIPTKGVLGAKHPKYKSPQYKTYHDQFFHEVASWDEMQEPVKRTKLQKAESISAQSPQQSPQAAPAEPKHNEKIRQVADSYAQSRGLKLNHNIPAAKVNPEHSKKIAEAFHSAKHEPQNPHVQQAYQSLIGETNDQFKHILGTGLKVSKMKPGMENPYKSSKDLFHDIKNNNHVWYFPTETGFGQQDVPDHPLMQPTEHMDAEGKPMVANDIFRIVHDYFGHAKEGNGFGPNGEEGAWQHHMQMYSPLAQKALTAETRGQNSWVNFGPHAEHNRQNPHLTRYADQKATILPDFAHQHGEQSIYTTLKKREVIMMKGAMKRLAAYDPSKDINVEDHKAIENWTQGDETHYRDDIPAMHPNAKTRALHKLSGVTQVRRHPETGERMFLLHRGMDMHELKQNHTNGQSVYGPKTKTTSWTPHYDIADNFARDRERPEDGRVVSAWIPESGIHHIPNATVIPDENKQFRNEHEIIVTHQAPHPHASPALVKQLAKPKIDLNQKINMKGAREKALKDPTTPEQMLQRQVSRTERAEKYKREKFGKREAIIANTISKGEISNKIKSGVAGLAIAASTLSPMTATGPTKLPEKAPMEQQVQAAAPVQPINRRKDRILNSIMDVESSGGKDTKHAKLPKESIHQGERAYGKYGLTPVIIRATIAKNPDLHKEHAAATKLMGDKMHDYMNKHPDLEHQIASKHYDRLVKQFGDNPDKIGYAWLNGITGTWKAIKEKRPLKHHWHVKKILNAYEKRKKAEK
jgi:hypothetical protein